MAKFDQIETGLEPLAARDAIHDYLWGQGWTVTQNGPWEADVERGSLGATALLGPFAGAGKHHVKFRMQVFATPGGVAAVRFQRFTGGDIGNKGAGRAAEIFAETVTEIAKQFGA
ncbi:hypothetical protein [Rarobacter incanus]|uniref:Polyketide cyclase/dehydrase/lipid transport protein n=1 Tax=Rarobacter incanus TaxID=153494 RepID=A0A542SQD0_9MICO|nr:hypothetical protein [Rarobacter incanus]TQK76795.1 hypothetical protein FB389_1486 [Rarobacter incanus]